MRLSSAAVLLLRPELESRDMRQTNTSISTYRLAIVFIVTALLTLPGCSGGGGGGSGNNNPPVANPDGPYTVAESGILAVNNGNGLLQNDSDPDGDLLTVNTTPVSGPANGALTLSSDGAFQYTHDKSETTADSFTYEVSDGKGGTAQAVATITITPVNDPPVANSDSNSVIEDSAVNPVSGDMRANDTDAEDATSQLTITQVDSDVTGTLTGTYGTLTWSTNGSYSYTLDNSDPDTDSLSKGQTVSEIFTYTVQDTSGATDTTTLTITVTGTNDAPVASSSCSTTPQELALTGTLSATDVDNTSSQLSYLPDTAPSKGTVLIDISGSFTYTPYSQTDPPFTGRGRDTFTYRVEDVDGGFNIGTGTVIINPKIMPLGDSITTGTGELSIGNRVGYRQKLFGDLGANGYVTDFVGSQSEGAFADSDHEGHGGWTASEIAFGQTADDGVFAWLEQQQNQADVVLLHAGTNTPSNESDIKNILDEIDNWEVSTNGNPVTVILARIIDKDPFSGTVTSFNDAVQTMALDRVNNPANLAYPDNIIIVDQENALIYPTANPNDMYDVRHPNGTGYGKMADVWFAALTDPSTGLLNKCP